MQIVNFPTFIKMRVQLIIFDMLPDAVAVDRVAWR